MGFMFLIVEQYLYKEMSTIHSITIAIDNSNVSDFYKQVFIGLLAIIVNASNHTEYISLKSQRCTILPTLINPSHPAPRRREKINLKLIFSDFFVVPQKSFMKALEAFIKPFEVLQRSVKIKIQVNFYFTTTF